jgi:hypothetical protein
MIILTKVITILLALTVISKTYLDFKKKQENIAVFLFWAIAWLFIMYAAIQPGKIYSLMQKFSKDNIGIGTFVGIAFIFLFYITYRVYIKANRLERKLHDMVMKLGLKDIEKK